MTTSSTPPTATASGPLDHLRLRLRGSELAFILLALLIGIAAGVLTVGQSGLAHRLQVWLYGLGADGHLSELAAVPRSRLLLLPLGGLVLGVFTLLVQARRRALIDAVEANALHGGRMSIRDSLVVAIQTLLSNGCGASVGLEAAYVQMGGGAASVVGRGLSLRRADLRTLVGAGAGAAIAASFGTPLAGAFYAFEIVIGAYTPAALAPVATACLGAVAVAQVLGATPYLIRVAPVGALTPRIYAAYLLLGVACALLGIVLMRLIALVERGVRQLPLPYWLRPALGGALLVPLAIANPQVLSSGHAALSHDLAASYSLAFIAVLFGLKSLASIVSLSFGFRGGLFFASLFLGSLAGHLYAGLGVPGAPPLNAGDAGLVGMAALAVSVIGGPLTMSMLVLECTHDFALTSAVIAAALIGNTLVRSLFGYSFSTWRLHLRGESVKSARDVGWTRQISAEQLMQRAPRTAAATLTAEQFARLFPLGSDFRVVLVDAAGAYAGIVSPDLAHACATPTTTTMSELARNRGIEVRANDTIVAVLEAFDRSQADELAVLDAQSRVLGVLSEAYVRKRYADELEKHQLELFGES